MKKVALLKLLEKLPANAEVKFVKDGNHYYNLRLEIEKDYDVFEEEFDDDGEVTKKLKTPRVEETTYIRLVIE